MRRGESSQKQKKTKENATRRGGVFRVRRVTGHVFCGSALIIVRRLLFFDLHAAGFHGADVP